MKLLEISTENVTSIRDFASDTAIYPALEQIHGYWDGLCNGSMVPYRGDVDPRALDSALEYTFILERVAPGVCRFRIAGRHLNDLLGMDVRGMPITAMFLPESRNEIIRLVETVCAEPGVKEINLNSAKSIGRGKLTGKILLTPLLDSQGQVTRILGGLQTTGNIGRAPRRFATSPGIRNSRTNHAAFAEEAGNFIPAPASTPMLKKADQTKATLKLVVNNG